MKISRFLISDKGVLAALFVFLLLLVSLAWTHSLAEARREAAEKALHFTGVRNDYGHPGVPPHRAFGEPPQTVWSVRSAYTPEQDSIVIDLSQGDIPLDSTMKVFANFVPERRQGAVNSHWMTQVSNGRFRAGGVKLALGTWIMGITGYQNSDVAFHVEQTLTVE